MFNDQRAKEVQIGFAEQCMIALEFLVSCMLLVYGHSVMLALYAVCSTVSIITSFEAAHWVRVASHGKPKVRLQACCKSLRNGTSTATHSLATVNSCGSLAATSNFDW